MKLLFKTLELKPSEWQAAIEKAKRKDPASLQAIEAELSAIAQRASLLMAYVCHRFNTGCGDQGHADSAREANRVLGRVRKALGFTYPDSASVRIP